MERVPHARLVPVAQPAPAGHAAAAAHLLRQHLPRDAALQDEDDPGQAGPVRHPGVAALGLGSLGREERLDHRPELVTDQRLRLLRLHPHLRQLQRQQLARRARTRDRQTYMAAR